MFETVAPPPAARPSKKPFYEALPLSIAFHAAVGVAALTANVWQVVFPMDSPAQAVAFSIAELPAPPPPPPPPPAAVPPEQLPVKQPLSHDIVAPTVIPDEIPVAQPEIVQMPPEQPPESGVVGGIFGGDIGGTPGGVIGGVVTDDRVHVDRDRPLPMIPLSQVYPIYPEKARLHYLEDELVIRYVIGRDGRVREVIVLSPPKNEIFVEATIRAIRNWRFRPFVKDGERQEVVHELTVYYRLQPAT